MFRDLVWDVRQYSEAAKAYLDIAATDKNAVYVQEAFNWGTNTGTESGYTLGTDDTDVTLSEDGNGDYDIYLRFQILQNEASADLLRTQSFRLKYQVDGGGYATTPTSSGNPVYINNHASLTHGDDCTARMTAPAHAFLSNNNGVADTSADTNVCTFTQNPGSPGEYIEVLYSLTLEDASLSAGNVLDFRVVFGSGGDTTQDTALDSYTVADATLTWAAAGGTGANLLTLLGVG